MQAILQLVPGVVGASAAFFVTRLFGWTELGFEFGVFLLSYVLVAVAVDRAMKRYGALGG